MRRALIAAALLLSALALRRRPRPPNLSCFAPPAVLIARPGIKAIGPVYPKTDIGKRLPLRQVDLDRSKDGKVVLVSPVRFTPTFVLVESGRELGRIEGYPGEDFFWGLLERLLLQHRL